MTSCTRTISLMWKGYLVQNLRGSAKLQYIMPYSGFSWVRKLSSKTTSVSLCNFWRENLPNPNRHFLSVFSIMHFTINFFNFKPKWFRKINCRKRPMRCSKISLRWFPRAARFWLDIFGKVLRRIVTRSQGSYGRSSFLVWTLGF